MTYREHKNIGKRITHIRKHSRKIGENRDHAPGSGLWTLIPICSWLQLVPIIYIYIYIYIFFFHALAKLVPVQGGGHGLRWFGNFQVDVFSCFTS